MTRFLSLLLARNFLQVDVPESASDLVSRLRASIEPPKMLRILSKRGYEGDVKDGGFQIRRIADALSRSDRKPAVIVKGIFHPQGDHTIVDVSVRHGWHLIVFGWIIVLIGISGPILSATGNMKRPQDSQPWWAWLVILGAGLFWHLGLVREINRITKEVSQMLIPNDSAQGSGSQSTLKA